MGSMSNNRGKAAPKRNGNDKKFDAVYPGAGWAGNNLSDDEKARCQSDLDHMEWDTLEVLLTAWGSGYQVTCKRDRGKPGVYMAVMTQCNPDAVDAHVWLSMRGSTPAKALGRLMWVWGVYYDRVLPKPGETSSGEIW